MATPCWVHPLKTTWKRMCRKFCEKSWGLKLSSSWAVEVMVQVWRIDRISWSDGNTIGEDKRVPFWVTTHSMSSHEKCQTIIFTLQTWESTDAILTDLIKHIKKHPPQRVFWTYIFNQSIRESLKGFHFIVRNGRPHIQVLTFCSAQWPSITWQS